MKDPRAKPNLGHCSNQELRQLDMPVAQLSPTLPAQGGGKRLE